MKFVLFLLCLLSLAFSEVDEEVFDYSEYYEDYGCSLKKTSKCCWRNNNNCCAPATGPRTCKGKFTICCKRKAYDMGSGDNTIIFYPY